VIDYFEEFPLPKECLPNALVNLLTPETPESPSKKVLVTSMKETNKYRDGYEYHHMLMACVPISDLDQLTVLRESTDGVVEFSTPCCSDLGGLAQFDPNVSGYGYIVASWGGSHYSYALAEKVWMTLGLSSRGIGNSEQRVIYDDLSVPALGVVEGNLSSEYYFTQSKQTEWTMRNDYLRDYLWKIGCYGVRSFFYEAYLDDHDLIRKLMNGADHFNERLGSGWGELDLRITDDGRILIQLWASVVAVPPELCVAKDKYALVWAGDSHPMTQQRARDFMASEYIYLDDRCLEKYEKDSMYEAVPFKSHTFYSSSPSYKGQWSFRDCDRVGRNLLKMPVYEIYRQLPDQEVYHLHQYAVPRSVAETFDHGEEHIVSKTDRLLKELILLSEHLSRVTSLAGGGTINPEQFIEFDRRLYKEEGFREFPIIQKMAQVAPLDMYEQDFLSRCKTLNEIIGKFKIGHLKRVLKLLGANGKDVEKYQGLKLIQALLSIFEYLDSQAEGPGALPQAAQNVDWKQANPGMAPLFINNDLRNAEAHEAVGKSLQALEKLGLDTATLSNGYGKALDLLLDQIICTFTRLNEHISNVLDR